LQNKERGNPLSFFYFKNISITENSETLSLTNKSICKKLVKEEELSEYIRYYILKHTLFKEILLYTIYIGFYIFYEVYSKK